MIFLITLPITSNRLVVGQMNESLSTFMMVAATVVIIVFLVIGIAFNALSNENDLHHDNMRYEHQIQFK